MNATELIDYLSRCISLPMSAPDCRPFWETVMYGSASIGALLACWFIWKLVDYRIKLAAARRAQQARDRIADAATMRKHVWNDPVDIADVTDPHLAKKIREELEKVMEQQRRKNLHME